MLGAFLLSEPAGSRNRNLFDQLFWKCTDHLEESMQAVMMASIALDDNGYRAKTGSLCASVVDLWSDTPTMSGQSLLDPYPSSLGSGQVPVDHYSVKLVDNPTFSGLIPIDLLGLGHFAVNTIPSRSTCVYSSMTGTSITCDDDPVLVSAVPGRLLVRMSLDDDSSINFVQKVRRNVLDQMSGRYATQIVSVGPDPLLVIMRREYPIYLHLIAQGNSFYIVWSDFKLPSLGSNVFVWPLDVFDRGAPDLALGFSLRMLRSRWARWLTPRKPPQTVERVDIMRIPRAISALQEWMYNHSA